MDNTDALIGSYKFPTADQLKTFAAFDNENVFVKDEQFSSLFGMYAPNTQSYALWMQFIPKFFEDGIKTPATPGE